MDFSPLRPDEWIKTDAELWSHFIQIRLAFEDGRDEVKEEKRENKQKEQRKAEAERKAKEFHKKHQEAAF